MSIFPTLGAPPTLAYARDMTTALVALGSNLGDRAAHLHAALARLAKIPSTKVLAVAGFRETEPVDCPQGMPAFINSAAKVETCIPAGDFLGHLLAIERDMGRLRTGDGGPAARTIDLDLILYGSEVIALPHLRVPHPRMHLRRFVLEPLAEIAPDLRHPLFEKTMRDLLSTLHNSPARERNDG